MERGRKMSNDSQFEKDVEQPEYFVWLTSLILFSMFAIIVSWNIAHWSWSV